MKKSEKRDYTPQIKELNTFVQTYLAPSSIEGIGVFAIRDIKEGQQMFLDNVPKLYNLPYDEFDKLYPQIAHEILQRFPQVINGSAFAYPTTRIQAYLNHSDTPNYDAIEDVALTFIRGGTEITEDYRKIENAEKIFPFMV